MLYGNYHTHTYRCGHAVGKDSEYVKYAIKNGFKALGFSDHAILKGVTQPGMRGDYSLLDEYVSSLRSLKKEYEKEIDIKIGFEAEYSIYLEGYYKELLSTGTVDYLILGQHCTFDKDLNPFFYFDGDRSTYKFFDMFIEDMIKGMKSGLFKYVCHPDYILMAYSYNDKHVKEGLSKAIDTAIECNMPIEINLNGINNTKNRLPENKYPNEEFFKEVGKKNAKVIIGVDAHRPESLEDARFDYAMELVKKYNLNLVTKLDI